MEVVVLGIADDEEADNGVDDSYRRVSLLQNLDRTFSGEEDARFTVGFLPKCLAWYRPKKPVGLTSGAEPRGSFS